VPMSPREAIDRCEPCPLRNEAWVVTPEWLEWLQGLR
jgi:hypothetical protein